MDEPTTAAGRALLRGKRVHTRVIAAIEAEARGQRDQALVAEVVALIDAHDRGLARDLSIGDVASATEAEMEPHVARLRELLGIPEPQ